MALVFLASASGAPGVTTTAVGTTLLWPRPAILLEADLSKPSGILPGLLRGQVDHSKGLTPIAVANQRGTLSIQTIWGQTVYIGPDKYLIPGFSSPAAARGTTGAFWSKLGEAFLGLESAGIDVLVDAGRLELDDPRTALLQQADTVAMLARPVLPDVAALRSRIDQLRADLTAVGHEDRLSLVLIESEIESFTAGEIAKTLGAPVMGRLPWDPRVAAVYSLGMETNKKTQKSALSRTLTSLAGSMTQSIIERKTKLGHRPSEMEPSS